MVSQSQVNVVFGLEGTVNEIMVLNEKYDVEYNPVYWPYMDFGWPSHQEHIAKLCDDMHALDDILQTQSMMCFMTAFRHWVRDTSIPKAEFTFPVSRFLFIGMLRDWIATGAWPYNRPCVQQYVGKSQSCMVISGRLIVHAPVFRIL